MTNQQLKLKARERILKNSGPLTGATFIYGALYVIVAGIILYVYSMSMLSKGVFNSLESMQLYVEKMSADYSYSLIVEGVNALMVALMATVLAGLQYMCIMSARGMEVKAGDVFYAIKRNPDKIIILSLIQALLSFVFAIPVNVLAYMSDNLNNSLILDAVYTIFMLLSVIGDIAVAIMMSQSVFEYIDNPDGSVMSYVENSMSIIKNNVGRYIKLWIGFIPLKIIAVFTMGLMNLWLLPYMWTTYALFYMDIKGENKQGNTIDVTIE